MDILKNLTMDEQAWADFLITRAGLFIFCSLLLVAAFKVHPLFFQKDSAGMLDARLSHLASYLEGVDSTNMQRPYYYGFETQDDITIGLSARYITATTERRNPVTRARALMTQVFPPNAVWNNRSGLMAAISDRCQGKTGIGEDVLQPSDWDRIRELLKEAESDLAVNPFIPDTTQPLIVEKIMLNIQGPEGIERRGITIVYQ